MAERKDDPVAPSLEMERAFTSGGGLTMQCVCGRVHFHGDERAGDWEEGELERLREKSKTDADTISSGASYADCNGQTFVIDCPCNGLRKYEDFLWQHRRQIAGYLSTRSATLKAASDFDHALVGNLTEKVFG